MVDIIKNIYNVGPGQPYSSVQKVLEELSVALFGGNFQLPPTSCDDGGQVNIVLRGSHKFLPFAVPDDMTPSIAEAGRYLIIRREEFTSSGELISDKLPIIAPDADGADQLDMENLVIGADLGSNNPNIRLRGLRVQRFVIGVRSGINNHNFHLDRSFITNNTNVQVFARDSEGAYFTNNIAIGGQYGIVAKSCKNIRAYHNTVFVDGATALDGVPKAGMILQSERTFGGDAPSLIYNIGNLVFTIGCPAYIFYDEDVGQQRLISDHNDIFAVDGPLVQIRQDTATMPNEEEVIGDEFYNLFEWTQEAQLGDFTDDLGQPIGVDQHSISAHPIFIVAVNSIEFENTSLLDLSLLQNSPLLERVPSFYDQTDPGDWIPDDFDTEWIWKDSLLFIREKPYTAIGANDAPSTNGYFGQDIFTSPLLVDTQQNCDIDPLVSAATQNVNMVFPELLPGYFYSHERKYYLYGQKGAFQLGHLARVELKTPGFLHHKDLKVTVRGIEVPESDYDISGRSLIIYARTVHIVSWADEVQIDGFIRDWKIGGLSLIPVYYRMKLDDGKISYVLPDKYQPTGPVVITDDRVNYRDPDDVVRRDFRVTFNEDRQETEIQFGDNTNWVKNAQFDITIDNATPAYWIVPTGSDAILADRDFAHIGDWSCALKHGPTSGQLKSSYVPTKSGEYTTYSWHALCPEVSMTGESIATGLLDINIEFYTADYTWISGQGHDFTCEPTAYNFTRYYATLGDETDVLPTNLFESEYAPLTRATGDMMSIPENSVYSTVEFRALSEVTWEPLSYVIVDAVQAEHESYPTAYHQQEDPIHMTVEFETSESNRFIDRRMNLSPVINQNPNGFLYITDMPASIWGGPETIETTSLHEYRWPEGRMFVLPWARMIGKDKLTQKSFLSDIPTKPMDIVEVFNYPRRAASSSMLPSTVIAAQGDTASYGINIEVLDDIGNPYSLRNYVVSIKEDNDMFPGWLSKRKFGAKEQLGTTIFGQLNERGTVIGYYTPPSAAAVRYVGDMPIPLISSGEAGLTDSISSIKTSYSISPENHGNISVFGVSGAYLKLFADEPLTGAMGILYDSNAGPYLSLEYPPVFGSVLLYVGSDQYYETYGDPQSKEYFVDYENAQLVLNRGADTSDPAFISYLPQFAYKDPGDTNTIVFHHDQVFGTGGWTGPIEVDYDALIRIEVNAQQPLSGEYVDSYYLIAQNSKLAYALGNEDALEF